MSVTASGTPAEAFASPDWISGCINPSASSDGLQKINFGLPAMALNVISAS
jgi:hypothetical protein